MLFMSSEFMQHNAAVTTQAMATHNAILRKAVTAHAGHVIEQEGDSWSVAFHRAVDAVAFCLQVSGVLCCKDKVVPQDGRSR